MDALEDGWAALDVFDAGGTDAGATGIGSAATESVTPNAGNAETPPVKSSRSRPAAFALSSAACALLFD